MYIYIVTYTYMYVNTHITCTYTYICIYVHVSNFMKGFVRASHGAHGGCRLDGSSQPGAFEGPRCADFWSQIEHAGP